MTEKYEQDSVTGEITSCEVVTLHTSGMRGAGEIEIVMKEAVAEISEYSVRYSDGKDRRVLEERAECSAESVLRLLNDCRVLSWDGFDGPHPEDVLDGTMFSLDAAVYGSRRISARGSENFPDHYWDFTRGLWELLREGSH